MTKIIVRRSWSEDTVKVWICEYIPGGARILSTEGTKMYVARRDAELGAPSFTIRTDVLEQLVKEAANIVPPQQAVVDHPRDAVSVCDRLLTMIERLCMAPTVYDCGKKSPSITLDSRTI